MFGGVWLWGCSGLTGFRGFSLSWSPLGMTNFKKPKILTLQTQQLQFLSYGAKKPFHLKICSWPFMELFKSFHAPLCPNGLDIILTFFRFEGWLRPGAVCLCVGNSNLGFFKKSQNLGGLTLGWLRPKAVRLGIRYSNLGFFQKSQKLVGV